LIYGTYTIPANYKQGDKLPAALNLDWRGIGKSTSKGNLLDLPIMVFAQAVRDVEYAYKFLRSVKGVDPERIGILGGAFGAKIALRAAKENPKLRAIALLSPVTKPLGLESDRQLIASIHQPLLLVTSDCFGEATTEIAVFIVRDKRHRVLTYRGGFLGYALFSIDQELEQNIAYWFREQLHDTR